MRRKQRREDRYERWDPDPRQKKERRPECMNWLTRENCRDCENRRQGSDIAIGRSDTAFPHNRRCRNRSHGKTVCTAQIPRRA